MARLRAVADTGPLVSAVNARERGHRVATDLVAAMGRSLIVPVPVAVEVDYLLRRRVGPGAARAFLAALAGDEHAIEPLSQGLFRRAAEIDHRYADLGLGLVDASVMAVAERRRLPILTFDFADFRAAPPERGSWALVIDEAQLAHAMEQTEPGRG